MAVGNEEAVAYRRLTRAAVATAVVFAVSGALLGTWVSRLPAIRDRLHASPAELGLVLLMPGVGSLVSMPSTGRLCRRLGSRGAVTVTALPVCAVQVLNGLAPSVWLLGASLLLFGLLYGAWDVSMNVQGSTVEQRAGRAWMPRYHACWSVGGIVGAALGALAARAGLPVAVHFALVAGVGAAVLVVALRLFVADREAGPPPRPAGSGRRWSLLTRRLVMIGLITLCSVIIEGASADWLALYLVDERHTAESVGAAGYALFACSMAAGRFGGTRATELLGRQRVVRVGGALTAAGVLVTVLGPGLAGAFAGTVLWALGVCLIFPATISAAGESPDRQADSIAAVSAVGYGGLLIGPPVIGLLANGLGIGRALLILLVLCAAISLLAPATRATFGPPPDRGVHPA